MWMPRQNVCSVVSLSAAESSTNTPVELPFVACVKENADPPCHHDHPVPLSFHDALRPVFSRDLIVDSLPNMFAWRRARHTTRPSATTLIHILSGLSNVSP